MKGKSTREKIANILLRFGLAFPFAYAAIRGFLDPQSWVSFFPSFATDYIPGAALIVIWGVIELILAGWIFFGRRIFWPSLVAALSLAGLIFFNQNLFDVLFRDVTIIALALAMALRHAKRPS